MFGTGKKRPATEPGAASTGGAACASGTAPAPGAGASTGKPAQDDGASCGIEMEAGCKRQRLQSVGEENAEGGGTSTSGSGAGAGDVSMARGDAEKTGAGTMIVQAGAVTDAQRHVQQQEVQCQDAEEGVREQQLGPTEEQTQKHQDVHDEQGQGATTDTVAVSQEAGLQGTGPVAARESEGGMKKSVSQTQAAARGSGGKAARPGSAAGAKQASADTKQRSIQSFFGKK